MLSLQLLKHTHIMLKLYFFDKLYSTMWKIRISQTVMLRVIICLLRLINKFFFLISNYLLERLVSRVRARIIAYINQLKKYSQVNFPAFLQFWKEKITLSGKGTHVCSFPDRVSAFQ
jgi:hypothetical protein